MDALVVRARSALLFGSLSILVGASSSVLAASHRTENFIVTAPSKALAVEICEAAERYRAELAVEWLGHKLPRWQDPCPIKAKVAPRLGAGGATSFLFETQDHQFARPISHRAGDGLFQAKPAGRPFGWEMSVQGSRERVLDSVLPHEVTHTIFASYFGRPLPRWADEGACTTVEHPSEKAKQHRMLYEFLKTDRGIAFNRMFSMNEYPADILPLYSQGFSLARFLIQQGGKRKFVKYIGDGLDSNNWTASTKTHYGFTSLSELQVTWLDWVRHGSPIKPPKRRDTPRDFQPDFGAHSEAISQLDATPRNENGQLTRESSLAGQSWYAQQGRNSKRTPPSNARVNSNSTKTTLLAKSNLTPVPPPRGRLASRPDENYHQREVMLEWGKPSPFLAPTLSNNGGTTWR